MTHITYIKSPFQSMSSPKFNDTNEQFNEIFELLISLDNTKQKDDVHQILLNALSYLDEDIEYYQANELFELILKCFSLFLNEFIPVFHDMMTKSKTSSYHIIITAAILSFYVQNDYLNFLSEYEQFVNESLNEIIQQIPKSDKKELFVFQREIPSHFKNDLIINLVLASKLNENIVNNIVIYIIKQKCTMKKVSNKIIFLVHKIIKEGFIDLIIPYLPNDGNFYSFLNIKDLEIIIPLISDQSFRKNIKQFEKIICKYSHINLPFINSFFQRCNDLNIKLKSINKIINCLTSNDITSQIIKYIKKYDLTFPVQIAQKFIDHPDHQFVFNISPTLKIIPKQMIYDSLFEMNDIKFFQNLFSLRNIVSPVLSTSEFYIHTFSCFYQNKNKITSKLMIKVAKTFQKFVNKEMFINTIDEIVFSFVSNNQNVLEIVSDFVKELDHDFKKLYFENEHMNKYMNTVLKKKSIPSHSFIKLINGESTNKTIRKNILLNQEIDSRLYYIYKFLNEKNPIKYRIIQPKNKNDSQLIDFIENNDFNLFPLIDDELLKFIMQALIFAENDKNMIYGLTNKTVLPFYAIALNNLKKDVDIFNNEKNTDLFLKSLKSMINDNSPLIISSINSILNSFIKSKSITKHIDIKIKIIDIFIESLLTNKCSPKNKIIISFLTSEINNLKYIKSNLNDLIMHITSDNKLENVIFMKKLLERFNYFKNSGQFFKIPSIFFQNTLINIISLIENTENIENTNSLISFILNAMIMNPSLRKCYFITYIQSLDNNHTIKKFIFINEVFKKFNENENEILEIFNQVYINHIESDNYVKKLSFNGDNYFKASFEIEKRIIKNLFNIIEKGKMKSRAFYCLKAIAYNFPFLFDSNPNQIFEAILPELNNFLVLFDDDENNRENNKIEENIKIAIYSHSFLISTLYSNKIMDSFVNWYFTNIEKFNSIQNYCFNHIFYSILQIGKLKRVMVASLLKYDYYNVLFKLMKDDIPEKIFCNHYKTLLCKLLFEFMNSFYKSENADFLAIDELQKMEFPFLHEFNNYKTFLPLKKTEMSSQNFIKIPNNKLSQKIWKFIDDIERIEFNNQLFDNSNNYNYICHKTNSPNIDVTYYFYNFVPLPTSALRIIFQKSEWMYEWITKDIKSPLFPEEREMLRNTLENIDKNMDKYQDDPLLTEFNINDHVSYHIFENNIFNINNFNSIPNNGFKLICKLIGLIISNENDSVPLLQLLAQNIDIIKVKYMENDEDTYNYFYRFLSVLVEISNLESFRINMYNIFGDDLYNLVLLPEYRVDSKILSKMADILINADLDEIPIFTENIFNFMFVSGNEDVVLKAIKLSEIYFEELIQKHMKIIKKLFNRYVRKKDFQFSTISYLANIIPSFNEHDINTILFDKLIQNFNSFGNKKEIVKLINLLTPKRNLYDSNIFSDIQQVPNDQDPPVPSSIIDSNPEFWNYFIDNRSTIKKIIEDNGLTLFNDNYDINKDNLMISLKLFDDYPQLYSFEFRYKLFYAKIKKEIDYDNYFELFIDRKNILESSFDQLKKFSEKDWKNDFQIHFIGEQGIDLGGLRRDWFINLSRTLFNTDISLFSITENMSYQPSIQSYANPDHLQLFEFAGYFIARAIIQGEHIDGHFSHSFLCNILDIETKLKDIEEISPNVYNSLKFILENDLDKYENLEFYFAIDHDNFDNVSTYEFIENGSQIKVTNENKHEYVKYMIDYYTKNSIECQNENFFDGFDSLIPFHFIKKFTPNELDLIISGKSIIDIDDIKNNTEYEFPYTKDSPPVILFFNSISKWNQDDLKKLIKFITGSPKVPANGFKHYKNIGIPIKIQSGGENEYLPTSFTCFNTLSLPNYQSEDELNFKFKQAIEIDSFDLQ